MAIKIGHASIDENGKIIKGKVGDQTTKEICIRQWYSKPWNIYIECTDDKISDLAAQYMEQICLDDNYGYDQGERLTGYNAIINNKAKVKGAKGEFDCSSLICSCYKLVGVNISPSHTTNSMRGALLATGKFKVYTDSKYLKSDKYAKRGGIYLKEGSHVIMALENGTEHKDVDSNKPAVTPYRTYKVVKGDTLSGIAKELLGDGNRYEEIMKLNGLKTTVINIGQKLKVPCK